MANENNQRLSAYFNFDRDLIRDCCVTLSFPWVAFRNLSSPRRSLREASLITTASLTCDSLL